MIAARHRLNRIGRSTNRYVASAGRAKIANVLARPGSTPTACAPKINASVANQNAGLQMGAEQINAGVAAQNAQTAGNMFGGVMQMAGAVVRDSVYRRVTNRCYICDKPFTDGKPAGEAGYFDADRQYIKVYCCHNAEYSQLLMKCQEKEQAVAAWVEKAEKAARQAMIDARSAARRTMPA